MSSSDKVRQDAQPAFVLHHYPFRETSLVIETFTRDFGRVAVMARGARRPKSRCAGYCWRSSRCLSAGQQERTAHLDKAEWQAGICRSRAVADLRFYLNELLLKLLPRDDPHSAVRNLPETLGALRAAAITQPILRRFEEPAARARLCDDARSRRRKRPADRGGAPLCLYHRARPVRSTAPDGKTR